MIPFYLTYTLRKEAISLAPKHLLCVIGEGIQLA